MKHEATLLLGLYFPDDFVFLFQP